MTHQHQTRLVLLLKDRGLASLAAFCIPNSNEFLLEYPEVEQSMRFHLTGFSGSTGESVVLSSGETWIAVDGRYEVQAERQSAPLGVKVLKASSQVNLISTLCEHLKKVGVTTLVMVGDRTSWSDYQQYVAKGFKIETISTQELKPYFDYESLPKDPPAAVVAIDRSWIAESFTTRAPRVARAEGQSLLLTQGDDISWLANCVSERKDADAHGAKVRSNLLAKALWIRDQLYIWTSPNCEISAEAQALSNQGIHFKSIPLSQWQKEWKNAFESHIKSQKEVSSLQIDALNASVSDVLFWKDLMESCGKTIDIEVSSVAKSKRLKSSEEKRHLQDINLRASEAVTQTLRWFQREYQKGNAIWESDFRDQCESHYRKVGAMGQSFGTIAAFGPNASLSHYGISGRGSQVNLEQGDVVLLDSGGQFPAGFVTDLTRTILVGLDKMAPARLAELRRAYTLVLKAQINGEMSVFPAGTPGSSIDYRVRAPLFACGLDFKHGTGHGVGFHVHEWGARISPWSTDALQLGMVGSIEPGYYPAEQYGFRHENLYIVSTHPKYSQYCYFEPLVWIAWQEAAIDRALLTSEESQYLDGYQKHCQQLGLDPAQL